MTRMRLPPELARPSKSQGFPDIPPARDCTLLTAITPTCPVWKAAGVLGGEGNKVSGSTTCHDTKAVMAWLLQYNEQVLFVQPQLAPPIRDVVY